MVVVLSEDHVVGGWSGEKYEEVGDDNEILLFFC